MTGIGSTTLTESIVRKLPYIRARLELSAVSGIDNSLKSEFLTYVLFRIVFQKTFRSL